MALNEVKEKVYLLENAIRKLDLVKRHLNRNASDIKGEIHSCVSHNLESLRGREVSLLSKVDEVLGLKEEALQQRQAQLNQALGVLQTRMAMMTADCVLDKQMAETLTTFNEIDLSPGETPHIAFRADHMSLRQSILNYGRVDANALPLPSAFDDPGKPSASLPRHLEEYDDVDHHIFHKTVEELRPDNLTAKTITVTIPKLSMKMEDWLQKRLSQTTGGASPVAVRPNVIASSGSSSVKRPSQTSCSQSSGGVSSLNNWLSQIKVHSDLEEEHDFEIVDNNRGKKDKCLSPEEKLCEEDLTPWLHNSPGYMETLMTAQGQRQSFFQHIPVDSKVWLQQACQQMSRLDEIKQKDFFHHISKEPSTWLRSRAHSKQPTPYLKGTRDDIGKGLSAGFKDKSIDRWLAMNSTTNEEKVETGNITNSCCTKNPWLMTPLKVKGESKATAPIPFQLEDICKANELCSSLSECVSKPNCLSVCQQEASGVKNPLDPTNVFKPLQLPLSEWLIPATNNGGDDGVICEEKMDICHEDVVNGDKNTPSHPCGESLFGHMADLSSDQWLIKPPGLTAETDLNSATSLPFKHIKEEANLWLQQTQDISSMPVAVESRPKSILLDGTLSCKSVSEWLLQPKCEDLPLPSKEAEFEMLMKEESEGWSLCSSPSSYNSEQFNKDVNVATSYMQKWIL